ncbi:hypothetical protein JAAARDRAFT_133074, partial [Jaapia argillacea MUCL 33604]
FASLCISSGGLTSFSPFEAYFEITSPTNGTQWVNGATNPVTWVKGVNDGIPSFDIELARLSTDGLIYIAKNVPATSTSINVALSNVPLADDYFLVFLNSTHGVGYVVSDQFAIVASASSTPSPVAGETVTVTSGPNPTQSFATTFPAIANGVEAPGFLLVRQSMPQIIAIAGAVGACLLGGAWTAL